MSEALAMVCNTLNSLPSPVIILNKEGVVVDANIAAKETHGVDCLTDISLPEEVLDSLSKVLSGENCTVMCKVSNKKTGKEVWLDVMANPVYTNSSSQPTGVSLYERDVTTRRAFVEELKTLRKTRAKR